MPLANFRPVSTTFFSPFGLMYQTLLLFATSTRVRDIDRAVVPHDEVVALETVGEDGRLASGILGENLRFAGRVA